MGARVHVAMLHLNTGRECHSRHSRGEGEARWPWPWPAFAAFAVCWQSRRRLSNEAQERVTAIHKARTLYILVYTV
jgi:hypothetical protein